MKENNFGKPHDQTGEGRRQELAVPRDIAQQEKTLETASHEDLVRRIKEDLARKREDWEESGRTDPFDPAEHLDFILTRPRRYDFAEQEEQREKTQRLARAWAAISFPHMLEGQYKNGVRGGVAANARLYGRYIELEPKAVKLLDAMAEAVGIPGTRGKTRIDVLQNFPPEQQQEIEEYYNRLLAKREGRAYTPRIRETNFRTFFRWVSNVSKMLTPPEREVAMTEKKSIFRQMLDEYLEEESEPLDLPDKDDSKPKSDKE